MEIFGRWTNAKSVLQHIKRDEYDQESDQTSDRHRREWLGHFLQGDQCVLFRFAVSTRIATAQTLASVVSEFRHANSAVLADNTPTVVHSGLAVHTRPTLGAGAAEVRVRCVRTCSYNRDTKCSVSSELWLESTVVEAGGRFTRPCVL